MKFYSGICLAVGVFTMLATLIVLVAITLVSIISAKAPEESTKYPILLPTPANDEYHLEYVELENETLIDWDNGFKKCGNPVEGCQPGANDNDLDKQISKPVQNETATIAPTFKPFIDFKEQPSLCRCDDKCIRYGDCCASVLINLKKIPKDTHWRCKKLLNTKHSVQMISKCPSDYSVDDINRKLCESEDHNTCPTSDLHSSSHYASHYCPLLDVPVYNNKTGNLYRSIFCARCHSVSNHEIQPMTHEILCSYNFTNRKEWEEFSKRSEYQRGKLQWKDPTNPSLHCNLFIKQLQPDSIKESIPDIRFCMNGFSEECSLDLSIEENLVTYSLCASYTQAVIVKKESASSFEPYKNPHCAKCDIPNIDIRKSPTCYRTRPRDRSGLPGMGTRMFASENVPVGINILFHFSLDMDDGYVGVTSKCEEDEILDFIRHKCVPVICQKNYELIDGKCEKVSLDDASIDDDNNDTSVHVPRDTNSSVFSNASEPCFLIIFHNGEYSQLENGSLAVNKSGGAEGVLIFQPGEYQKYEGDGSNISMSICAKNVEKTFESSFAPALSYLSNIVLIVSVICSLAHVALYIILPKMRNLPGNNLLCLTACLLISNFIFLTFISTSHSTICLVASITMHYFLLSGFLWMFVMSFDIWRTFSSEFVVRRYSGDSTRTFIKYNIFAWTLPLIIVTLAAITDFALPESVLVDTYFGPVMKKLRPFYGHNNVCWIGQRLSLFAFFALPVGVIILCNLILFARTAVTIWTQNKEGRRFINGTGGASPNNSGNNVRPVGNTKIPLQSRNSGSTKKSDKMRFKLYAKLALIMGLTWILGLLSGFTEWEWLWYPFVLCNGLQGTFIFVAFDCKPKIIKMVKDECGWRKRKQEKCDTGEGSSSLNTGSGRTTITTLSSILAKSPEKSSNGGNLHIIHRTSTEKQASVMEYKI